MANAFRHKRYFKEIGKKEGTQPAGPPRNTGGDVSGTTQPETLNEEKTFSNAESTWNGWGMPAVWNTSSPTKSFALADSGKTVVVTFEFDSLSDQDAFKTAVDNAYSAGGTNAFPNKLITHVKTEWLHEDASTSGSDENIVPLPSV